MKNGAGWCCGISSLVLLGCLLVFFFSGTSLSVMVTRPAELDMNGANSISIIPFQETGRPSKILATLNILNSILNSDPIDTRTKIARYLTTELQVGLATSPYLKLIDANVVASALSKGRNSPADAYITGYLASFDTDLRTRTEEEKRNNKTVEVLQYSRTASATVVYQIVDAKTNEILQSQSVDISDYSLWTESKFLVPVAFDLLEPKLKSIAETILRQVQPYKQSLTVKLLSPKAKHPSLKEAKDLAKHDEFDQAYQLYHQVYKDTGDFAAGFNAGQMLLLKGDFKGAKELMTELIKSGHRKEVKKAKEALKKIEFEIWSAQTLKEQRLKAQLNREL